MGVTVDVVVATVLFGSEVCTGNKKGACAKLTAGVSKRSVMKASRVFGDITLNNITTDCRS